MPRLPLCLRGGAGGAPQRGRSLLVLVMLPQFPLYNCWRKKSPRATTRLPHALCHGVPAQEPAPVVGLGPSPAVAGVPKALPGGTAAPCPFLAEGRCCRSKQDAASLARIVVQWQRSGDGLSRGTRGAVCLRSVFPNPPEQGDPALDPPELIRGPVFAMR